MVAPIMGGQQMHGLSRKVTVCNSALEMSYEYDVGGERIFNTGLNMKIRTE